MKKTSNKSYVSNVLYVCEVIDSCKTIEQLGNAKRWALKVLDGNLPALVNTAISFRLAIIFVKSKQLDCQRAQP